MSKHRLQRRKISRKYSQGDEGKKGEEEEKRKKRKKKEIRLRSDQTHFLSFTSRLRLHKFVATSSY